MYLNQLVMSKCTLTSSPWHSSSHVASALTMASSMEMKKPLMLLIQDIMDILYGIRNENRYILLTVLRKNLLPEWLQGWQVLRSKLVWMYPKMELDHFRYHQAMPIYIIIA